MENEELENEASESETVEGVDDDEVDAILDETCGLSPVKKLRAIVTKIVSSPQHRRRFCWLSRKNYGTPNAPSGKDLCTLMMIRDVITRWNYTHAMIKRALLLRKWVIERDVVPIRDLLLSGSEWKVLEQLCSMLEIFTQVTYQMSRSNTPTLPWAIPMYEYMKKSLKSNSEDVTLPQQLRRATNAGLDKLNKYYGLVQKNHFNYIATICHPALRLNWFKNISDESFNYAQTVFQHVIDQYTGSNSSPLSSTPAPKVVDNSNNFLATIATVKTATPDNSAGILSEFERYAVLGQGAGDMALQSPLLWWKIHAHEFPIISKIARAYLAIPGAIVSVERLFSRSRIYARINVLLLKQAL